MLLACRIRGSFAEKASSQENRLHLLELREVEILYNLLKVAYAFKQQCLVTTVVLFEKL